MTTLLLLSLAILAPKPVPVAQSKIIGVTIATGGYAFVTRQIDIPAGGQGEVNLLPQAVLGTVWFATDEDTHIDSIQTGPSIHESQVPLQSLPELMGANVGKVITVTCKGVTYTGKLLSSLADGNAVMEISGNATYLSLAGITSLKAEGGLKYEKGEKSKSWAMDITLSNDKPRSIVMMDLEKGMNWSAAYLLDVSDPKTGDFTERAEISNSVGDLENLEVHLATALPSVMNLGQLDDLFVQMMGDQPMVQMDAAPGAFGGGFGGGGGRMMYAKAMSTENGMSVSPLASVSNRNLFLYRIPNVTLLNNHKGYFVSLRKKVQYQESYDWNVNNLSSWPGSYQPIDVQSNVNQAIYDNFHFKNDTGQPLSAGPLTFMSKGEILGQANLGDIAKDEQATIRLSESSDLKGTFSQSEIARKPSAKTQTEIVRADGKTTVEVKHVWDLSTVKTNLLVNNYKSTEETVIITCPFMGTVTDAGGGDVTYQNMMYNLNRGGSIKFKVTIPAHSNRSVSFTADIYIPQN